MQQQKLSIYRVKHTVFFSGLANDCNDRLTLDVLAKDADEASKSAGKHHLAVMDEERTPARPLYKRAKLEEVSLLAEADIVS